MALFNFKEDKNKSTNQTSNADEKPKQQIDVEKMKERLRNAIKNKNLVQQEEHQEAAS